MALKQLSERIDHIAQSNACVSMYKILLLALRLLRIVVQVCNEGCSARSQFIE